MTSRATLTAALVASLAAGPASAEIRFQSAALGQLSSQAGGGGGGGPKTSEAKGAPVRAPFTKGLGLSPDERKALELAGLPTEQAALVQQAATMIKWFYADSNSLKEGQLYGSAMQGLRAPLKPGEPASYAAIRGMVKTLDAHSEFFSPAELAAFKQSLVGSFGGLGATLKEKARGEGQTVTLVYPAGGGAEAGLKAGDVIVAVDGRDVLPLSTDEVIALTKGAPGSSVTLRVARTDPGASAAQTLMLRAVRREIKTPNLFSEMLPGGVGYIYFNEFRPADRRFAGTPLEGTLAAFEEALAALRRQGMRRLIIDERNNVGGDRETVAEVAQLFLAKGKTIVTFKDSADDVLAFRAKEAGPYAGLPVKIVVNGFSVSGAEVLAAALQDNKAAVVVGARTFGKGSAQSVLSLKDGSGLKLTIEKWFRPDGRSVQGDEGGLMGRAGVRGGVTPDVAVSVDPGVEGAAMTRVYQKLNGVALDPAGPIPDPALEAALR